MTASWVHDLARTCAEHGPTVRVLVLATDGSVPREAGAAMLVWASGQAGTIGGGALEFDATAAARAMIGSVDDGFHRETRRYPLGPALGQCCGGSVRVMFEHFDARTAEALWSDDPASAVVHSLADNAPPQAHSGGETGTPALEKAIASVNAGGTPIVVPDTDGRPGWFVEPAIQPTIPVYLYGAGHVGRALASVLAGTAVDLRWVDTDPSRFPEAVPDHATPIVAADPSIIARTAPEGAAHIVMTYSHARDLSICHALLEHGVFGHLGLIGSATKRARFRSRLTALGVAPATLDRMVCPIGLPSLKGKAPAVIAIGVAADLLERIEAQRHSESEPTRRVSLA